MTTEKDPMKLPRRARAAGEARQTAPGTSEAETSNTPMSAGGQDANRRVLKALIVGPRVKENVTTGRTKELPTDDLIENLVAANRVLEPPFEPLVLAMLPEHSSEMTPSVEAMEVNCDGFGHKLEPRVRLSPDVPDAVHKAVAQERTRIVNFFNNCSLDDSFTGLRKKTRHDLEITGNAYWEVIRSPLTGEIQGINHIASHQMRLGVQDEGFTEYERKIHVLNPDGSVSIDKELAAKRFRRFVQSRIGNISRTFANAQGYHVRWFKEYQDPRVIDNETGDVVTGDAAKDFPTQKRASEIIHWRLYSARTPYGLPRYIGVLLTIFGDRAAEEINFTTLKNNNIPSMAVLTTGQLTDGTINRINEFVETQVQGSENYSRFLIIEAEGASESGEASGVPKLEIQPLTDSQMRDMLFKEYGETNAKKIRRSWRLPPIFVGLTEDYNKATADSSRKLADEQVFKPERDEFDAKINRTIMLELDAVYHSFLSKGPNVTDDQDLISVLTAAEKTGALTPRIAHEILEDILNKDLPPIDPKKLDPDTPFSLQIAERVKNESTHATGVADIGNMVTAKKSMGPVASKRELLAGILAFRSELEKDLSGALHGDED